jgi:hypothetical protein
VIRRTAAPFVIATAKTVVSFALLWSGFRSVSDDDFSRVVIAQQFVVHPQVDPSGTSWLPLPFWVYGGVMKAFGPSIATAQITAILLGVYAAVGVWVIARSLDLSPRAALLGGLIAASIPHAAYYGAAMVPDYPTAVLALAACATLSVKHGPTRTVGAIAACMATLCRYETWPVAVVVTAYAAFDAKHQQQERRWLLGAAVLAPAGAIAWMSHGVMRHHDAFFFVKRVTAYRRALGSDSIPWEMRLLKQPLALFTGEPELALLAVGLPLIAWLALGPNGLRGRAWVRPALAIGSVIGFLVIGDLLDGAPTHHEDRTLLLAWLGMALLVGALLDRLLQRALTRTAQFAFKSRTALLVGIGSLLGTGLVIRPFVAKNEPFVDRSRELHIGQLANQRILPGERLAVYTDDYGYFAVQAGFGRPEDSAPLLRRDPRQPEQDPMASPEGLARRLDVLQARHLVLPVGNRAVLGDKARIEVESNGLLLVTRR